MSSTVLLVKSISNKNAAISAQKQREIVIRYRGFNDEYQKFLKAAMANANVEVGKNTATNRNVTRKRVANTSASLAYVTKALAKSLETYAKYMSDKSIGTQPQRDSLREYVQNLNEYLNILKHIERGSTTTRTIRGLPVEFKHNITRVKVGKNNYRVTYNDYRANAVALKAGESSINMKGLLSLLRETLSPEFADQLVNAPNVAGPGSLFGAEGGRRKTHKRSHSRRKTRRN
jgi:hypothetical protein